MDIKWRKREGVVYSTASDFEYKSNEEPEEADIEPAKQRLLVTLDKRQRAGKQVTLVSGFVGSAATLSDLGRKLKQACGVGGSAKDGEILIQGDHRDKVVALLNQLGYNAKRGN